MRRRNERTLIYGGLPMAVVSVLPDDVQSARERYIEDTAHEMQYLYANGAVELGLSAANKSEWWEGGIGPSLRRTESFEYLADSGMQVDSQGRVWYPSGDDSRGRLS